MNTEKNDTPSSNNKRFPDGFLWGASTSHFQIEGNPLEIQNRLSDWSLWTQEPGRIADGSNADKACQFYDNYVSDLAILSQLNLNTFRLSLNWAAICPGQSSDGKSKINRQMLDYYRQVLQAAKNRNIKTFVTLFHFCLPQWLAEIGGWTNEKTAYEFSEFARLVANELGDLVDFWQTLNEPLSYAYEGYLNGIWPPGYKNEQVKCFMAIRNLLIGHATAYQGIHEIDKDALVSYAIHWRDFIPRNASNPLDQFVAYCRNKIFNHLFPLAVQTGILECPFPFSLFSGLNNLAGPIAGVKDSADYLAINYYTRDISEFSLTAPSLPLGRRSDLQILPVNALGWESSPATLLQLLTNDTRPYQIDSKGQSRPVYITENGYATRFAHDLTLGDWSLNDEERCQYLHSHLLSIYEAIKAGVNVKGYLHWSLLDNFEWAEGLQIRFGLVRISYPTQERTLRDSAHLFSKIASSNSLVDYKI